MRPMGWLRRASGVLVVTLLSVSSLCLGQEDAYRDALAEPELSSLGRGLLPVGVPDVSRAEPSVRKILESTRAEVVQSLEKGGDDEELGRAFGELAEFYHAHHVYVSAEPCYLNAAKLQPAEFRWVYLLGYLYDQTGRLESAADTLQRALVMRPEYLAGSFRLARVYLQLGRFQEAERLFHKAADGDPALAASAWLELGKMALDEGRAEQAATLLTQALRASPQSLRIHYLLAMAYRRMGDMEQAKQHLAQYGEGEPSHPDSLVESLNERASGLQTFYHIAIKAVHSGNHQEALKYFAEALALDPENVNARVSLARSAFVAGQHERARDELLRALALDPDHSLGNFLLGVLLESEGAQEEGLDRLRVTLRLEPGHAGASHVLANVAMTQGDFATAAEYYGQVVRQAPNNHPARLMEALAMLRAGKPQSEVKARLEEGLSDYPDERMYAHALSRLLAASPDPDVRDGARAQALAQGLFDHSPFLEHAETLAMAYAEQGEFDQAISLQQDCINASMMAGRVELIARLEENLDRYRAGQPCRNPWPTDDPIFRPMPVDALALFREYPTDRAY